jgi:hypothetical protein
MEWLDRRVGWSMGIKDSCRWGVGWMDWGEGAVDVQVDVRLDHTCHLLIHLGTVVLTREGLKLSIKLEDFVSIEL